MGVEETDVFIALEALDNGGLAKSRKTASPKNPNGEPVATQEELMEEMKEGTRGHTRPGDGFSHSRSSSG